MSGVKLMIDGRGIDVIDELIRRGENPRPLLAEIGEHLLESTKDRFVSKLGPDGRRWEPVSPAYAARKAAGKVTSHRGDQRSRDPEDLLVLTHQLADNIAMQVDDKSVVVGSPEPYAAAMQFGIPGRNLVARPWLGLSAEDEREIEGIVGDYFAAVVTGGF